MTWYPIRDDYLKLLPLALSDVIMVEEDRQRRLLRLQEDARRLA
ncbi:hypothetical protein SANTM175S_10788 [Streptomyces antimycoticus]